MNLASVTDYRFPISDRQYMDVISGGFLYQLGKRPLIADNNNFALGAIPE